MTTSNGDGVIRIGRKGIKKFAFGDGPVFEVDVVRAFHEWLRTDEQYRKEEGENKGKVLAEDLPAYHQAAVEFAQLLATPVGSQDVPIITVAEALDFKARLCEQYGELADFFLPKKRQKDESPDTSGVELQFSEEPAHSPSSTS